MRLICTNDDCMYTCQEFEAAGSYLTPECPKCWSPMELLEGVDPRRHELDRAEAQRLADEDAWYAQRKAQTPIEIPLVNFRVRQAS